MPLSPLGEEGQSKLLPLLLVQIMRWLLFLRCPQPREPIDIFDKVLIMDENTVRRNRLRLEQVCPGI